MGALTTTTTKRNKKNSIEELSNSTIAHVRLKCHILRKLRNGTQLFRNRMEFYVNLIIWKHYIQLLVVLIEKKICMLEWKGEMRKLLVFVFWKSLHNMFGICFIHRFFEFAMCNINKQKYKCESVKWESGIDWNSGWHWTFQEEKLFMDRIYDPR